MKKLFTIVTAILMTATFGMAQMPQQDPKERVKNQLERYQPELQLNAEQTAKFEAVLLAEAEQMGKLFEASNGDREAMRASREKLTAETTAKVKGVLTPEQFKKYEAMMAERRANRPQPQQ